MTYCYLLSYTLFYFAVTKSVEKNTNCNSFLPVVISVPSDKISFSFDGHIIEVDSSINDDALCRVINALKSS